LQYPRTPRYPRFNNASHAFAECSAVDLKSAGIALKMVGDFAGCAGSSTFAICTVIGKLLTTLVVAASALGGPLVYWTFSAARVPWPSSVVRASPLSKLPGKLVLAGGTFIDEMGAEFVRLAGGTEARLVLIPTAYGPTEEEGIEQFYEQWRQWKPGKITVLHTRDRSVANDAEFAKPLKDATGVWFYGGQQVRLVDTYGGTLVERELRALFERGGAIGGNCAGAMAQLRGGDGPRRNDDRRQ
jgi:hypothetical protein